MTSSTNDKEVDHAFTILDQILSPANAQLYLPFLDKVDPVKLQLPDYEKFVKEPMWLRKIQSKFHEHSYESIKEFVCDFRLMLLNCYRYNGVTSRLGRVAEKLELLFEQKLNLLPSEIKAKTTIQATLCGLSPEEELTDSNDLPSKRRNTTRLIPSANTIGRSSPMRTLMEEFERSKRDGLFTYLLGDEVEADASNLNEDEGVALIVSRLNSWQKKRHDQRLISTWPEFWANENKAAQARLNQMNGMSEFFELYQLVFAFDEVIGISDSLSAVTLHRELVGRTGALTNISSLFYQHRRLLSISELELAYSIDVRKSLLMSVVFNGLLVSTSGSKEASELASALDKYRDFKDSILANTINTQMSEYKGGNIVAMLGSLKPGGYEKWHERLKERIESWYTTMAYAKSSNKKPGWIWRKIGVMSTFFDMFGETTNPLESRKFHEFSLYQQIFLTKTLFENVLRTHAKTRTNLDRIVDWTEIREQELGCDPTENTVYFHIPGIFSYSPLNSIRIYKMSRLNQADWNPDEFIASLDLAKSSNQVQLNEEACLFNPLDDSVENSFYFVPGPMFHLPRWVPEHLASYIQKRWLSLLNTQVLLQQAAQQERQSGDKKGQGPKSQELKRLLSSGCKWLPMGSMEALYAAEGKNRLGKYSGSSRTKTAHLKRQETSEKKTLALFQEEPIMEQSDYYRLRAPQNAPYPPGMHNKIKALCSGRLDLVFNDDLNNSDEEDSGSSDEDEKIYDQDAKCDPDDEDSQLTTGKQGNGVPSIQAKADEESNTQSSEDAYSHFAKRNAVSEEMGGLKLKIKLSPSKIETTESSKVSTPKPSPDVAPKPEEPSPKPEEPAPSCPNPDTPSTEPCEAEKVPSIPQDSTHDETLKAEENELDTRIPDDAHFSLVADNLSSLQRLLDHLKEKYDSLPEDEAVPMEKEASDQESEEVVPSNSRKRKARRTETNTPPSKRSKRAPKTVVEEFTPPPVYPKRSIGDLISALTTITMEYQEMGNSKESARVDAEKLTHLRFRKDFEQFAEKKKITQQDLLMPVGPEKVVQTQVTMGFIDTKTGNITLAPVTTDGSDHRTQRSARREESKRQTRQRQKVNNPPPAYEDDDPEDERNSDEENHENPSLARGNRKTARNEDADDDYFQEDDVSDYSDDYDEQDDPTDGSYAPSFGGRSRSKGGNRRSSNCMSPSGRKNVDYSNVQFIANRPLVPIAPKPSGNAKPVPLFLAAQRNQSGMLTSPIRSFPIVTTSSSGILRTGLTFNPRQIITTSNGQTASLVTQTKPTASPAPSKNIFRIRDTLFNEEAKPVKVVEGKIVPIPFDMVAKETVEEAKAMIEKYRSGKIPVATLTKTKEVPAKQENGGKNGHEEKPVNGEETSNTKKPQEAEDPKDTVSSKPPSANSDQEQVSTSQSPTTGNEVPPIAQPPTTATTVTTT